MQTFEQLDPDLETCKTKHWKGRDLPFPILLDATGDTIRALGITGYPTNLLIDPEGKLRRGGGEHALRAELMKTDPAVEKHLAKLKKAGAGSFARIAKAVAKQDDEVAAWALVLVAEDEKGVTEKKLLALLPLLARMKSESAHTFLLGERALKAKSAKVRLAAVEALQTIEEPPRALPWIVTQALEVEEDKKVKKRLEAWVAKLKEEAEKKAGKQ